MASENATGEEESVAAQIDVIKTTAAYLRERYERDSVVVNEQGLFDRSVIKKSTGGRPEGSISDPDAQRRISWFLGEKNWSQPKINDLLQLDRKLAPDLKASVLNLPTGSGKATGVKGTLGLRAASILSTLEPDEQRAVHTIIAKTGQRSCPSNFREIYPLAPAREFPGSTP
jgi:hypothetical protein